MFGWVLRILLFLIVLRLVLRFVAGLLQGLQGAPPRAATRGRTARDAAAVSLVRDPVCGTYVVRSRALTSVSNGSTVHFCSDACRRQFERQASSRPA
jgi:YHS domain-containing protein